MDVLKNGRGEVTSPVGVGKRKVHRLPGFPTRSEVELLTGGGLGTGIV